MKILIKWTVRIAGLLLITGICVGAIAYAFLLRTLPSDSGTAYIPQLSQSVNLVRDKEGVAHINAKSLSDLAAAQGYTHAQERLWQMETFRMAAQGRLSEMFGETTLDTDKFLRVLGLAQYSKQSYEKLKPQTKEILKAYSHGINAFMNRKTRLFEPSLSTEFMILGHQPEPWQPWQSLMTVKLMALTLGSNMSKEIRRLALASKGFNNKEIDDLVRYHPQDNPPPMPDLRALYGFPPTGKPIKEVKLKVGRLALNIPGFDLAWPIGVTASNNWVVAGSRTKSGKVLLANDPHLGLTSPSIWFLNHLSWQENGVTKNLVGVSMPSIPLIMLGRTDHTAWGFTTSNLDSQDIYIERINPGNPDEYLTAEGWKSFEKREETIKISGKPDVKYEIRSTIHGPLLPGSYKNLNKYLPENHVAALKWLALTNDDTTMDILLGFSSAQNVAQFIEGSRSMVSPMQSIVVGDTEGNIGFVAPSRVAVRNPENKIMGRAPVPGWLEKYEWQGNLKFEQLPQAQNPTSGVLFSANSKIVDKKYPHHLTFDWAENFRHKRVEQLIANNNAAHDIDSMKKGHRDVYSPALVQFRDEALAIMPQGTTINSDIKNALRNWDGYMRKSSSVALLMMGWFKEISEQLLQDDLGEEYDLFARGNMTVVLGIIKEGGARDWCDNRKQTGRQTCGQIVLSSLVAAINNLKKSYADEWQNWRWGEAHIAYGQHRPFAKVSPLNRLFNVEIASGGGPYTLLRGQTDFGKKENPFYNYHASSYRAIYDFANLNNSLYIHTTGQSGNFLSPFFSNFSKRWADGEYIKLSTSQETYQKDAIGKWVFKPIP